MTILVTGDAGFIGTHFIAGRLARDDEPVRDFPRLTCARGACRNLLARPCGA